MTEAVVETRNLMATRFEVALPGTDRVRLLAAAEQALDTVEQLEAQLSMYRPESELSGINAYAAAGPVRVEPRLFRLLWTAQEISRRTGNAFDPTVAPLLRAWGFIGGSGEAADPQALAEARERSGLHLVELDEVTSTVRFLREGVSLDLGAIGKGYAIDRAVEALEEAGIASGLIHGGTSTVYGLGAPPGSEGWRVALRDPTRGPEATFGSVLLRDRALSVSAPHGKAFQHGDRLYGHVLDPRTGEPAQAALLAAVAHSSATLTDALSTALLVLGEAGLETLAREWPDADFLVITPGEGGVWASTAGPDPEFFRLD
ncbi:MAG TPA: FAD:protein FMN transferase [Armatimonadota bacterium]|nr:FAD:protein FMN transferase [Armatimonadota bacterium]